MIENVIKRMSWETHFVINVDLTETKKGIYDFKSKQHPS